MLKEDIPEDIKLIILTISAIFLLLAFFIVFVVILFTLRKNKMIKEKQLMQANFTQELLRAQIEIQEQTMQNISQEIHDNIGQALTLAKLNLNTLPLQVDNPSTIKINNSRDLITKSIQDLRNLSKSLHGDRIAETGLILSIENELKLLESTGKIETEFALEGEPVKLSAQHNTVIFRVVQEAMNNVIKHASASRLAVSIKYSNDEIALKIQDNGNGFELEKLNQTEKGIGLKSMENRVKLLGGIFGLKSSPGTGTIISLSFKL